MKEFWIAVFACALAGCSSGPASKTTEPADAKTGLIPETTKSAEARDHFHKGEALFYNLRNEEAAAELNQALQLDSGFVLAHAFHAQTQTGERAAKEADDASAAAGSLPDAERLFVQGIGAGLRGDAAEGEKLLRQLTTSAPKDWRSHYALGFQLLNEQKYDQAVPALKKATELNPNAGVALNMLGYASLRQGDNAGAVNAFDQYTKLLPQEPNPQDSLGEALLAAGRFQEAEAAFAKALMLAPQFWNAHEGIAFARFYQGDWAGGTKELEQAKATATDASNKVVIDGEIAAAAAAQGRTADALKVLDSSEKAPGADRGTLAFVPVNRAQVLIAGGQPKQAIAALAPALSAGDDKSLPAGIARRVRTQGLRARVTAEAMLGDAKAAEATAALLQNEASARTDDPVAQRTAAYANGMVAMAKKDFAGAGAQFDKCSQEDDVCQWQRIAALERAGKKDDAASSRERWMRLYKRDPVYLMVRSQLTRTSNKRNTE
jgi:tetratricopeptide (TPR) repeat protein